MAYLPVALKIAILALWMLGTPLLAGGLFVTGRNGLQWKKEELAVMIPHAFMSGQFLLWALFWIICMPCVLLEADFGVVVGCYLVATGLVLLCGAGCYARALRTHRLHVADQKHPSVQTERGSKAFWALFVALLVLELVQSVRLTYRDGDDAYYVAVSSLTQDSDTMYQKLPYTGGTTDVDIRHGLAPLPIWIAFLARISSLKAVSVAHVAVPLLFIPQTYLLFYLMGRRLFAGRERRIPLFLVFTEILILFGDYSLYTAESFMLARSRQGKAALGSIVIPALFVLLLALFESMQEQKSAGIRYWILFACVMMTGCLCTTMGAVLCCLLIATAGMCGVVCYRKPKIVLPLALCCLPCMVCATIYLLN